MTPSWGRAYMVCKHSACSNWIYSDKLRPGTKCRKCGTWWPTYAKTTGKGKGYGKPANKANNGSRNWPEPPPGLSKLKPLKRTKVQQEATELLSTAWTSLSEDTQTKLQAIGIGPRKPEEPQLQEVLKSHMQSLPPQVQDLVNKLTTPEPEKLPPSSKAKSVS